MIKRSKTGFQAPAITLLVVLLSGALICTSFSCAPKSGEIPLAVKTVRGEIEEARADIERLYPGKSYVPPEMDLAEEHYILVEEAISADDMVEAADHARIALTESRIAVARAQTRKYEEKIQASETKITMAQEAQAKLLARVKERTEETARLEAEKEAALKIGAAREMALEAEEAAARKVRETELAAALKIQEAKERSAEWIYKVAQGIIPDGLVSLEPAGLVIRLPGSFFLSGSAEISQSAYPQLKQIVEFLDRYPQFFVSVDGHTDITGNPDKNKTLSLKRAQHVAKHLIDSGGFLPARFNIIGHGDTRPIASNRTKEGRSRNRRVEIVVHIEEM